MLIISNLSDQNLSKISVIYTFVTILRPKGFINLYMINELKVIHIRGKIVGKDDRPPVSSNSLNQVFVLQTCQRMVIAGFNFWPEYEVSAQGISSDMPFETYHGTEAYQFLLEVLCGLQSRLPGESEIAGQIKTSFAHYLARADRNRPLCQTLEKLFKDGKSIRTHHMSKIGQYSYAGLCKRLIENHLGKEQHNKANCKVAIVGSGQLAQDLGKLLQKKSSLTFFARNSEKASVLREQFQAEIGDWQKLNNELLDYKIIINTIAPDQTLLNPDFFDKWSINNHFAGLFIDLSSPCVIDTAQGPENGVMRLQDLFGLGDKLSLVKNKQISQARQAINELAKYRTFSHVLSMPFGWEEVQFA